jgi:hypothetical protein
MMLRAWLLVPVLLAGCGDRPPTKLIEGYCLAGEAPRCYFAREIMTDGF